MAQEPSPIYVKERPENLDSLQSYTSSLSSMQDYSSLPNDNEPNFMYMVKDRDRVDQQPKPKGMD